ncbi:hypothetical protein R3W88_032373 [Solanum pinnatisectum]|uniref:Uncharacterized protein n=1 Tax=Solanum pinnatisectum TaxID=50273 RepID=A0AAV9LP05_9SOLN|nr:hypothetical protein R3W88_032373 [Solanum pinnatisectum]
MAYAAITCLMRTIQQSIQLTGCNLQSFYEQFKSLRANLEKHAGDHDALKSLEAEIIELVCTTEDILDLESRNVKNPISKIIAFWKLHSLLKQAVGRIDSTLNKWMEMQNMYTKSKDEEAHNLDLASTTSISQHVVEPQDMMVGHENELEMIMQDQLARGASELEVVSIVGMGGIGKTTLADKIYNHPFIMSRFDIRAKATVSQEYCAKKVLLSLLSSTSGKIDEHQDGGQLADRLQKSLKGRRYLVVIDDIWTERAWDNIKLCFPDCNCGSRILLTTRNMEVAEYASSGKPPNQMRLLNFDESWKLLQREVFVKNCFSPEFEQLGKQIALKCGGLPLAIVVIAGLLSKIGEAFDEWTSVAENVSSVVSTDHNVQCMRVLALSYHHLPNHLRACFLYFAMFPEDTVIFVNKLVKLWAAEGFLKAEMMKSIEEVAEKCVKDLIDRNLIFVHSVSSFDGKIKACRMHDVIRELCLREASNTNFVNVMMDNQNHGVRISIRSKQSKLAASQLSMVRNKDSYSVLLFTEDPSSSTVMQHLKHFKVLRVLDLASLAWHIFPSCIVELFHLRYLALCVYSSSNDRDICIPPSITRLRYLQTLILKFPTSLAWKIFKMSQLRHLSLDWNYLNESMGRSWLLRNLQCLSGLNPLSCTSSIFRLLPNVKKLQICGIQEDYIRKDKVFDDLCCLDQLTELKFKIRKMIGRAIYDTSFVLPPLGAFTKNLKKLAFTGTRLHWEDLEILGKLPKLEALKLGYDACIGTDWEVGEEGFSHLKFLRLKHLYLHNWRASSDHFPRLERLVIIRCWSMYSIPQDFVDITTLQLIHISDCAKSVGNSAKKIQQEIEDSYGSSVEVCISVSPFN